MGVAAAHLLSSQSRASQSWHPLFLPNQPPPPLICPSQSGAEEWKGMAVTRAAPAVADSPFPAREETRSGGASTCASGGGSCPLWLKVFFSLTYLGLSLSRCDRVRRPRATREEQPYRLGMRMRCQKTPPRVRPSSLSR
jgi:hypothetical protein